VEEPNARLEARSTLEYLFGKHQESSRVIAVLHFVDGLTLDEVAKHVGMSVPGVRKRLRALRQTLVEMEAS
jgi:RNA polymerase sigma-70 factor (ECF subfamily)